MNRPIRKGQLSASRVWWLLSQTIYMPMYTHCITPLYHYHIRIPYKPGYSVGKSYGPNRFPLFSWSWQFYIQCLPCVIITIQIHLWYACPRISFSHVVPYHSRILRNSRFFLGFCRSFPMVPPKGCLEHEEELAADFPDHGFVCEYQGRCA